MIQGNFLLTVCGFCREGYFLTDLGRDHGCAESQNPPKETIDGPLETPGVEPVALFSGGRRVTGKY